MLPRPAAALLVILLAVSGHAGQAAHLAGARPGLGQRAGVVANARAVTPGLRERQVVGGSEICRVKDEGSGKTMRIWMAPVSKFLGQEVNLRYLEFDPPASLESAPTNAQSEARCLGQPSPSCLAEACGACPCTRDSREMLSPPMRLVFQQLEPQLCGTPGGTRKLLILGLGGGELAAQVAAECPAVHIDAVEICAAVMDLAQRYMGLTAGPGLALNQGSALAEVRRLARSNHTAFDAVVIDCYSGQGRVPIECRSQEFLKFVRQILKPGGIALQSMWHYAPEDAETVAQEFMDAKTAYAQEFETEPLVLPVDMPIDIHWVDILRARRPGSFDVGGLRHFGNTSSK